MLVYVATSLKRSYYKCVPLVFILLYMCPTSIHTTIYVSSICGDFFEEIVLILCVCVCVYVCVCVCVRVRVRVRVCVDVC
jgi:hypothetical protein